MSDHLVIIGEYLESTIEGTPLGLGGLKVDHAGVHLCSGYGRCHVSVSWTEVERIELDGGDDVAHHDAAAAGAPADRCARLFRKKKPVRRDAVLVTISCRDGSAVVLRSRPTGRKGGSYQDLRDRLSPYIGLITQSA